jgi:hypothetical protein
MASTDEIILNMVQTIEGLEKIHNVDRACITQIKSSLDVEIKKAKSSANWQWLPGEV